MTADSGGPDTPKSDDSGGSADSDADKEAGGSAGSNADKEAGGGAGSDASSDDATETAAQPTGSSTAASIGFLLAGMALAAAFVEWTPAVAMYGVPSFPGALTAGLAMAVLLARRHGNIDRSVSVLAVLGFLGVLGSAAAALLLPGFSGGEPPTPGFGVYIALLVGVVGLGVATADYIGMRNDALLARLREGLISAGYGIGGLLVGFLSAILFISILGPFLPESWLFSVQTVAFSIGLGVVALAYAVKHPTGLDYFDIQMPDRRGWLYVVGGTLGMFAVLIATGLASNFLGLPSAEHGILQTAQVTPSILLPLIPLSLLAIGPGEELLNRNIVQKHLYGTYSRSGAILVAALVFTVIHVPAYGGGSTPAALFVTLVRLFMISLVLGAVYERTDNIVVASLVHGGYNAIQFGAAYILITRGMM